MERFFVGKLESWAAIQPFECKITHESYRASGAKRQGPRVAKHKRGIVAVEVDLPNGDTLVFRVNS
jgi:hypothetical protein